MTEAGSEGGRWVKLDPGDVFPVGPYTLRFELGAEADASKAIPNILRDPAAVNEEKDRAAAAVEANAAKAVPNILRDPAAVKEENDRTAPVEPQLEESKPASLPDFTPPLQPQPED